MIAETVRRILGTRLSPPPAPLGPLSPLRSPVMYGSETVQWPVSSALDYQQPTESPSIVQLGRKLLECQRDNKFLRQELLSCPIRKDSIIQNYQHTLSSVLNQQRLYDTQRLCFSTWRSKHRYNCIANMKKSTAALKQELRLICTEFESSMTDIIRTVDDVRSTCPTGVLTTTEVRPIALEVIRYRMLTFLIHFSQEIG
ncbi:hypothetical protein GEMRC1_006418 [Eukaryota sp. GEM-RC1]